MSSLQQAFNRRTSWPEWTTTVATAVVFGAVIVHRATSCGLLGDELMFVHAIDLGLRNSLMAAGSSHPPLLRLVVQVIADPATSPDWLLRLPCLICAIGCVFVWQRVLLRIIKRRGVRCMLLLAMTFNPLWLSQAFQCLPYSPLVFCSSLHCLMWMRFIEASGSKRAAAIILSGSVLPWIHFFGVNVLVAGQMIWLMLIWTRQATLRQFVYVNLVVLILTLPVVPLAVFYIVHDKPYPLLEINDYWSYFLSASSWCFWHVTVPGLESEQPWFIIVYLAAITLVVRRLVLNRSNSVDHAADQISQNHQLVALCFLLAGFTATQAHSLLSQTAMWPRYMLAGSWIHLPVVAMLLSTFRFERTSIALVTACATLVLSPWGFMATDTSTGSDYSDVAAYIQSRKQNHDGFLVQSMDLWQGPNHFDQLWLERYADSIVPPVWGSHRSRSNLKVSGLSLPHLGPDVQRVWVYSHLFKEDWLRAQQIDGWTLSEIANFGGPFPLALFRRNAASESDVASQQLRRLSSM